MSVLDPPAVAAPGDTAAPQSGSRLGARYQAYALCLLMLVYAFNVLDRQIVTILAEPIKRELHLADWQLGMVTGLSFAVFYTFLGLPIARLADRMDRVAIIGGSLAIWSVFTAACGLARTLPQLLLARLGVGFGEAGCTPAAFSLITEYTPLRRRASALAFYSLGGPLGTLAGSAMGGLIAEHWGWRAAFLVAGAPGVVFALLVVFTLDEPRRRLSTKIKAASGSMRDSLAELWRTPAFWWVSLATSTTGFVYYGQSAFYGSLFLRTHSADLASLAARFHMGPAGFLGLSLGLIMGVAPLFGSVLGGHLADRAAARHRAGYTLVPMIALAVAAPLFAAVPLQESAIGSMLMLVPAVFVHSLTYGSTYASVQSLVSPGTRALASAVMLFLTNLIGLGLGPLSVGLLSDTLSAAHGPILGLRWAMAALAPVIALGSIFYMLARRTFAVHASSREAEPAAS